jgi:hypothetical protein
MMASVPWFDRDGVLDAPIDVDTHDFDRLMRTPGAILMEQRKLKPKRGPRDYFLLASAATMSCIWTKMKQDRTPSGGG